jgi:hypothetical protein
VHGDGNTRVREAALVALAQLMVTTLVIVHAMRVWVGLAVALVLVALPLGRAVRVLSKADRARLLTIFGASVILTALPSPGLLSSMYMLQWAITLFAWACVLAMVPVPQTASQGSGSFPTRMHVVALLAGAVAVWVVGAAVSGGVRPWLIDEVLYLLQAQHAWRPPFMVPVDPSLAKFFQLRQTYVIGGYLNCQYPPGWPLLLSLVQSVPAQWALLLALHVGLVAATYAFGARAVSPPVGFLAAVLVALNGLEITQSLGFFPHLFTAALVLTSAILMMRGLGEQGRRRFVSWVAAGLLMGWVFAARPLTGLALGGTLVGFVLVRERLPYRMAWPLARAMALGAALPLAYLLWYNRVTTGATLRFGYDLANHGLHAMGFGVRGFVSYTDHGLPAREVIDFGLGQALAHLATTVREALADFWPASLVLPLLFLGSHSGRRVRWRVVAPFAVLPAAYFFYFFHAERFVFELLPFAMVATGWLIAGIWERQRQLAMVAVALLIGARALGVGRALLERRGRVERRRGLYGAIASARREHHKVLLFVKDASRGAWGREIVLEGLYAYNLRGEFHGDVVVSRDLGPEDQVLMAKYPEHYPVFVSIASPDREAR